MAFRQELKDKLLNFETVAFDDLALEVFAYQAVENELYRQYLHYLRINPHHVKNIRQIPFMPIEFFKYHQVICKGLKTKQIFESSGTTGGNTSRHFVADPEFYQALSEKIFERFYGKIADYQILALLPSYLERQGSSLVFMVENFIKKAKSASGFYLNEMKDLGRKLEELQKKEDKILLIGVTFALLDFAENHAVNLSKVTLMETGGMKGRRKEMLREEVHDFLSKELKVNQVHSEYGMTELLSQAYSKGEGVFELPHTMRILLRDFTDPFDLESRRQHGGVNVIDLANIDSCAFIETKDIGRMQGADFQILGRYDYADVRGCNLLIN